MNANALKRYCEMCDRWWGSRAYDCPACGDKTVPRARLATCSRCGKTKPQHYGAARCYRDEDVQFIPAR